jgi:hypothetical protein
MFNFRIRVRVAGIFALNGQTLVTDQENIVSAAQEIAQTRRCVTASVVRAARRLPVRRRPRR